jgi:hypothetical protein
VIRWKAATVLALALLVSGCASLPNGADGKLVNEWPAMAEPAGWTPAAGGCQDDFQNFLSRNSYKPADCGKLHYYEFIHVGQITGAEADLQTSPDAGTVTYRKAWAECDTKATEYLGGPWRDRKIGVKVSFPSGAAWKGGARWYVCSIAQVSQVSRPPVFTTGPLKAKFAEPLFEFGCYQVTAAEGKVTEYVSTACTSPHNAEFVGAAEWAVDFAVADAETESDRNKRHSICAKVVHSFVGASVNTGTWTWTPSEDDWTSGDDSLRCYLYSGTTSLKRSMKGVGAKGWLK